MFLVRLLLLVHVRLATQPMLVAPSDCCMLCTCIARGEVELAASLLPVLQLVATSCRKTFTFGGYIMNCCTLGS